MRRNMRVLLTPLLLILLSTPCLAARALVPGGQVVGMQLSAEGVVVAGFSEDFESAAEAAGVQTGDVIVKVNGAAVDNLETLKDALQQGPEAALTIRREDETIELTVPLKKSDGAWRLGALVRQGVSGLGTISYYDPKTGVFGALGHGVGDGKSRMLLPIREGSLVQASVTGVERGTAGAPGALQGCFDAEKTLGVIEENTAHGVYGRLTEAIPGDSFPTADASELTLGPAVIRATVDEGGVREYAVQILRTDLSEEADGRNLLLEVTDPALLERTGGIVQGMSGSPILQNGKLIGAVTHVLVGDPTKGYGIFIENMLAAGETPPPALLSQAPFSVSDKPKTSREPGSLLSDSNRFAGLESVYDEPVIARRRKAPTRQSVPLMASP